MAQAAAAKIGRENGAKRQRARGVRAAATGDGDVAVPVRGCAGARIAGEAAAGASIVISISCVAMPGYLRGTTQQFAGASDRTIAIKLGTSQLRALSLPGSFST